MKTAVKFLIYNSMWFATARLASSSYEALTLVFPLILAFIFWKSSTLTEKKFGFIFILFGLLFDFIAQETGAVTFRGSFPIPLPLWLIAMWLLFGIITADLLKAFRNQLLILAGLGAIFGPLSYAYGEKLSIFTFNHKISIGLYAIFWAFYLVVGLKIYRRISVS